MAHVRRQYDTRISEVHTNTEAENNIHGICDADVRLSSYYSCDRACRFCAVIHGTKPASTLVGTATPSIGQVRHNDDDDDDDVISCTVLVISKT